MRVNLDILICLFCLVKTESRLRRRVFICFFMLLVCSHSHSQNQSLGFKHFTISDGISNSYITDILQDKRGYIWIGTTDGLNCFDGYDFKVYKKDPFNKTTVGGNYIRCLYEDSHGNLWVGLLNGIVSKFDPKVEKFTNYSCILKKSKVLGDGDISGIVEDKDGLLWIAVDRKGFVSFNPDTGNFSYYESASDSINSLSHNATTSIAIGRDNCIWITTWGGGLNRFDPKKKKFTHYMDSVGVSDDVQCRHLRCQYHDRYGNVWVGTDHSGLYCVNIETKQWKQYTHTSGDVNGLSHETVTDITEDANGDMWVATLGGGVCIWDRKKTEFRYAVAGKGAWSLLTNSVNSLYQDDAGSMWVGTRNGIHFYNSLMMKFNKYDVKDWDEQSEDGCIFSILKDRAGRILVKGRNELISFDEKTNEAMVVDFVKPQYEKVRKLVMFEDSKGDLWFGFSHDVIGKYNPIKKSYEKIMMRSPWKDCVPFRNVNAFYEDTDGTIWIASEIGALNYNPQTRVFAPLFQSKDLIYPEDKVNVIVRDSYGELWLGTEGGLKRYGVDGVLITNYVVNSDDEKSISDNVITSIHEDKKKTLWIGTKGGLHRFNRDDSSFSLITRPGEMLGDAVMGIVEDESNNLWISSTIGLIQFNYLLHTFRVFNENDGLQSNEFNQGVFSKGRDGEILFGGINGFNSFNPDSIKKNTIVPAVYITDFQIFNQSVVPGDNSVLKLPVEQTRKIVLKYWQSMFSFQFVALNYLSPGKNQYAYKLEGFDNQWIYTKSDKRYATYTNLPPGNYVFKVKAANNDGVWNEEGAEIKVVILPPLWKTWWAYLIYFSLFVGFFIFILYYFVNREKIKAKIELERLEAKRQHEADELKLQLFANISHEFRTSLTLILGPLEHIMVKVKDRNDKSLLEVMHRNASRLMRLINQLLDFRKIEANKLSVQLVTQDIIPFLKEVFEIFKFHAEQRNVTYSFSSSFDKLVIDFDKDKVDKILYNLLSNAFNYTDEGGHISVILDQAQEKGKMYVSIKVVDDGVGIPAESLEKLFTIFYQINEKRIKNRGGTGLGLNMTKELIHLLGGHIYVDSEQDKGSTFTVLLPISNSSFVSSGKTEEVVPSVEGIEVEKAVDVQEESSRCSDGGLILVVEDDSDMRLFIKSILIPEFRIIEAVNGMDGMEKALEYIPDIIISDVMMPEMDGTELLEKIKSDERINHIPVILLTALNEERQILKSFYVGVDDYITKPFSAPILKARVSNILSNRRKWWEKYATLKGQQDSVSNDYEGKYINPFVQKMTEIIWENMADPDFNLEILSSELCMSSSQLARKTKALMGITPYNFIIKTRMDYAVNEMKHTDKTIAEIAFDCGYQEKSNFSRAFTKYFGMSPMQYRKTI
ncbi:hybrid sensor histidine kinase/response regulator transcription factor [Bacteroides xylanisolvens]|uniref:hybrid sensor histidine kinase/response regulator transcription factor n=1 Tax=Bacteroides xylanisolvens TaxID=371601 RepID=UPI00189B3283|nr:hybrid sensor histidine kinase/response regulator transcription factor [Bacteroides xylanisolvens]